MCALCDRPWRPDRPTWIFLFEVSASYARELKGLGDYPHRVIHSREDPFGMAILSRYPLEAIAHGEDREGVPTLSADLSWRGMKVTLVAEHPMPPIAPDFHALRRERLLAAVERARGGPAIIAGDLNATPWSSAFARLTEHGFRRATGLAPSWPSLTHAFPGIPIDHVLVSRHWVVASEERGEDLGSDHYPVSVVLSHRGERSE